MRRGETHEPGTCGLPDRARAGCDRRLVVALDHPRRAARAPPLRRIPEEPRTRQEHPDGAAARAGRPRHPRDAACFRRQRLSGICADAEGSRAVPGAGGLAAMERGIRRDARGDRNHPGRSRERSPGQEARVARPRRPAARRRRYDAETAACNVVIARSVRGEVLDCFASLAMTEKVTPAELTTVPPSAAAAHAPPPRAAPSTIDK